MPGARRDRGGIAALRGTRTAADERGAAAAERLLDALRQIRWTWQSIAPAVRIRPFPAITSVDGRSQRRMDAIHRVGVAGTAQRRDPAVADRKSTRLNSSHVAISYAVFCLKKKKN